MTPVSAAGQVRELLAGAVSRESVRPEDARAGASYERVTIGRDAYFVKRLSPASDWIMRVTGDHVHRPYLVWQAGIMDRPRPASTTPWSRWAWTAKETTPCSLW